MWIEMQQRRTINDKDKEDDDYSAGTLQPASIGRRKPYYSIFPTKEARSVKLKIEFPAALSCWDSPRCSVVKGELYTIGNTFAQDNLRSPDMTHLQEKVSVN